MSEETVVDRVAAGSRAAATWRAGDAVEVVALILTGYACHLYYNLVGHISSLRGLDFGPYLLSPLDRAIPYEPIWVHPYQIAYFVPALVLVLVVARIGIDALAIRRIVITFLSLLFVHYALYLTLPTSAGSVRLDDAAIGGGTLGSLVRYQYRIATVWCAWPSLHVSACWFFYRLLRQHYRRIHWIYLIWFVAMFVGTVAIKIHYVADGLTGLVLSEGAYRLLRHFERTEALGWVWRSEGLRAAFHIAVVVVLAAAIPLVMRASGFSGPLYAVGLGR